MKKFFFLLMIFFGLTGMASVKDFSIENAFSEQPFIQAPPRNGCKSLTECVPKKPIETPAISISSINSASLMAGAMGFQTKIIFVNWKKNTEIPLSLENNMELERMSRLANAGLLQLPMLRKFQKKIGTQFKPVQTTTTWKIPENKSFSTKQSLPTQNN